MRLSFWLTMLALGFLGWGAAAARAQDTIDARWIWFDERNPAQEAPAGKVWFRREVYMSGPCTGAAYVAADDEFTLWVNGQKIGSGGGEKSSRFNLNGIVERGINVIAVEATNKTARAGLIVDGEIRHQGGGSVRFDTSAEWKATRTAPLGDGWLKPRFEDAAWLPAKDLGKHAESPWKAIVFETSFFDRFHIPPGFKLQRIAEAPLCGSAVAITWGNRGRLLVSPEKAPILSLIDKNGDGTYDEKIVYTEDVTNCQGLCMIGDDLYAVGNGPEGTGIYKLPDRNHDDRADEVTVILQHKGNMGEHGPHDIVVGPDGWLYHNMGNHAWVAPDRNEPDNPVGAYYEGDLLQPRFEDAGGHAVGIKTPGGTVWRFSPDGKKWWLHTAGFRNHYDIAFNQQGDLFTFDSDMEWDVGMPWYRPVRVNHCTAGAEFGWRSGAANGPEYFSDSLPATVNTGRGSPTGVVFYEHHQFPEKYRGSFLCCDWSMGRILAVNLKEQGASFGGTYESLVAGNPLNVSDIEVDRDGSVVFSTGGRGTEGGIYRLSYGEGGKPARAKNIAELLTLPQPNSAWAREDALAIKKATDEKWGIKLAQAAKSAKTPAGRVRALTLLAQFGPKPDMKLLGSCAAEKVPAVRRAAAALLGEHSGAEVAKLLTSLLNDADDHVKRRACESFVRSGEHAPVDVLLKLLGSNDRWLRFAARLTLEQIPAEKWREAALKSDNPVVATEALLAMYRLDRGLIDTERLMYMDKALAIELALVDRSLTPTQTLDVIRMAQLSLQSVGEERLNYQLAEKAHALMLKHIASANSAPLSKEIAMETARIAAHLQHEKAIESLLSAMETRPDDSQWQIHFLLCLAYCKNSWSTEQRTRLFKWYESTRDWDGGDSFVGFLANFISAIQQRWSPEDRKDLLLKWRKWPFAANTLLRRAGPETIADFEGVVASIIEELNKTPGDPLGDDILTAAIEALGKSDSPGAKKSLRKLFDEHADRGDLLARSLAARPDADDVPYLLRSLKFGNSTTLQLSLQALGKVKFKPDKPDAFRQVIVAGLKLRGEGGLAAAILLDKWSGESAARGATVQQVMAHYQTWFSKKFPDEPPPALPAVDTAKTRYTVEQLVKFLETPEGNAGDVARGKQLFTKANCAKCHRFGSEGAGVGPDLTSVRRRFQRKEIVESIIAPSAVISDQYRSVTVQTSDGLVHTGLPVPQPGTRNLVLLLPDATKLEIAPKEIEERSPARLSVMPDGLLKDLSLQDIADLFAYMETSKSAPVAAAPEK